VTLKRPAHPTDPLDITVLGRHLDELRRAKRSTLAQNLTIEVLYALLHEVIDLRQKIEERLPKPE